MEARVSRITSLILAIGIAVAFIFTISVSEFTYIGIPKETLGRQIPPFISTYLLLDLVAIAFVVFASVACCIAMLRE